MQTKKPDLKKIFISYYYSNEKNHILEAFILYIYLFLYIFHDDPFIHFLVAGICEELSWHFEPDGESLMITTNPPTRKVSRRTRIPEEGQLSCLSSAGRWPSHIEHHEGNSSSQFCVRWCVVRVCVSMNIGDAEQVRFEPQSARDMLVTVSLFMDATGIEMGNESGNMELKPRIGGIISWWCGKSYSWCWMSRFYEETKAWCRRRTSRGWYLDTCT